MKAAWDACKAVGAEPPDAVAAFFGDESPDESGPTVSLYGHSSVSEWSNDHESGLVVDLRRIPEGITHLRFFNSW